jgi:hypothetical protein
VSVGGNLVFVGFRVVYRLTSRILKSIWYRMNNFNNYKPTRLSKVNTSIFLS